MIPQTTLACLFNPCAHEATPWPSKTFHQDSQGGCGGVGVEDSIETQAGSLRGKSLLGDPEEAGAGVIGCVPGSGSV